MTKDAHQRTSRSLRVPVARLLRQPGVRQELQRSVAVEQLRVGSAVIAAESAASIDLWIEAINDAVTVTGTVSADFEATCGRCLDTMVQRVDAEVKEIFERRPEEGETYLLDGDHIDLEALVREALALALPIAPVCATDCAGAAPDLYPLVEPGDDSAEADVVNDVEPAPVTDPRWAALSELKLD